MIKSFCKIGQISDKKLMAIILAALVLSILRFGFFYSVYNQDNTVITDPDTLSYRHISLSIFERGKYERVEGTPETHRPPAYPVYLAINYVVFGKDSLLAPVIVQHVLFFIVSIIVGYLAYQLGGLMAAVVSYGFIFTDFTVFYYFNEVLSEALFTSLLMFALFFYWQSLKMEGNRWLNVLLSGLLLTVVIFTRPVGMFLIYPMAVILGLGIYMETKSVGTSLKSVVVFLLPWVVLGGLWYFRMYGITGKFVFSDYESAAIFRRLYPVLEDANNYSNAEAAAYLTGLIQQGLLATEVYFKVLFEHPWSFFKETSLDLLRLLLSPGQWHLKFYFPSLFSNQFSLEPLLLGGNFTLILDEAFQRPLMYFVVIAIVFFHLVLMYAGIVFSFISLSDLTRSQILLFATILMIISYFVLVTAGFIGHPRFRVVFTPMLAISAGVGASWLCGKIFCSHT